MGHAEGGEGVGKVLDEGGNWEGCEEAGEVGVGALGWSHGELGLEVERAQARRRGE